MTKRRMAQLMSQRMSDGRALALHKEMMKDPEYAAKWNELTAQLFGVLADIPEEALDDSHEPS